MATKKLCKFCHQRPAVGYKYCEECGKHKNAISKAIRAGRDPQLLNFLGKKLCEWCGERPVGKGRSKFCDVCGERESVILMARKKGLNGSNYTFVENRTCSWCGRRPVAEGNQKYCEICNKYATQIGDAKKRGLTVADLDYEKTAICECCGERPVIRRGAKYCTKCSKHSNQIAKARRKGKDITQLPFTGKKLCEFCHKRPVGKYKAKYCDICSQHANYIASCKRQGKDLSQIDFAEPKMCEYCGKRPVGKGRKKYCDECGKYAQRILYIQKHGITAKEDFSQPRVCKECGEPIGFRRSVYCEHCGPHANTIMNARRRGYTGDFWFNGKKCACCGKRPVGKGRVIYCDHCIKKYSRYEILRRSDIRRIEAGEKLSKCLICKQRERIPGEAYCRTCKNSVQRASNKGIYSYQEITKTRICECCGTRPVACHKTKYCEVCAKHETQIIRWKAKGKDLSQLWFTGKKLCEWCGEKYISGNGSNKYCDECAEIVYNLPSERWKRALDKIEKNRPVCKICGEKLSAGGLYGFCCRTCFNKNKVEKNRLALAKKRAESGQTVNKEKPKKLCAKCGIFERAKSSCYCTACLREERYTLNFVKGKKSLLTPVADPEIYYTEKSVTVACPLCEEEKCLPMLPLGGRCKKRILEAPNKSNVWQAVLRKRGIKAPSLEDIDPKVAKIRSNCVRCKEKPRKAGWIYCEDCLKAIQEERAQEFKAGLAGARI